MLENVEDDRLYNTSVKLKTPLGYRISCIKVLLCRISGDLHVEMVETTVFLSMLF